MANFSKPAVFNRLVASLTAIACTTAVIYPPPAHSVGVNLDIRTIAFGVKAERIVEKLKIAIEKGKTNKIVDYMGCVE